MKLSPQQTEFLRRVSQTDEGREWQGILQSCILALKDDCVLGDLSKEAAKSAIEQLSELVDKITLLAAQTGEAPEKSMHV